MPISCQKYLLDLLSKRDYFEKKLRQKAKEKEYEDNEIEASVVWLQQKNFLNDSRFATNLVEKYQRLGKNQNYVLGKLIARGLEPKSASNYLQDFRETPDFNSLKTKIERKYDCDLGNWSKLDSKLKYKIQQFIYTKGYKNSQEVLRKLLELTF